MIFLIDCFNSTFAWYSATANVAVTTTQDHAYNITAAQTGASLEGIQLTFTVAAKAGNADPVQLSHVATAAGTDAASTSYAIGDVLYGAMKNGVEDYTMKWAGNNSSVRLIGEFEVTVDIATAAGNITAGQKAALSGKTATFNLESVGNAVILSVTTLTNANSDAATEATTPTVTVSFSVSNDTLSAVVSAQSHKYYAIRTNNFQGLEYVNGEEAADNSNPGYGHENTSQNATYHASDAIQVVAGQSVTVNA